MFGNDPVILAIQVLVLLFSVIIHEVMHGLVALKFGDHTAERAGRLTLNPLPHIDPFMTILLPLLLIFSGSHFIIGGAKPVPVNPLNFTNLRKGELFVSAAGIFSNFGLAIIGAVFFHILNNFYPQIILMYFATKLVQINLILGVFNLLPIPPLDGSKILMSQLSYQAANTYSRLEPFGFLILFLLLYLNILSPILGAIMIPLYHLLQIPLF
jgi:Zn-dependent protease